MSNLKRQAAIGRGRKGEALSAFYLQMRGWRIIARGYVTGRGTGAGEVDIIARRGRMLIFVEVKARPSRTQAAEAITGQQKARIIRGAEAFMAARPELADLDMRFDAILVSPKRLPYHIADAWRPDW